MSNVTNLRAVLALALMAMLLGACGGGGGSSGGGGTVKPQPAYDMQPVGPSLNGAQVNRPFSVTLNFFEPGTTNPRNVQSNETITATKAAGPGNLTGTTSRNGNNSPSLTFDNLIFDQVGQYQLSFNGPKATAGVTTILFNVGAQLDLRFTATPTGALRNRNFSVSVETFDPVSGLAQAPGYALDISLSVATGSGNLGGTTTQTLSAGSTLTFTQVTYDTAGNLSLRASAFGFPDAVSAVFVVDTIVMAFSGTPASVLVNGSFSLTLNLTGQISGLPVSPSPAISGTLTVASGGGALGGGTSANSSGSTLTFSGLTYNQIGAATFTASSPDAASVTTGTINFGVDLLVSATGPTSVAPNASWSPFNFRVVDGTGATWLGSAGPLNWSLTNSASAQIQSGSVGFTAGIASVTPSPIATAGSYTLTGSITNPNTDSASIGLSVTSFTLINEPGAFAALKSTRVNNPYSDSASHAAPGGTLSYGLLSGTLPAGLNLNTSNGTISGTPTTAGSYSFTLYALLSGSQAQPIRCALAVFTANETEFVSGQNFKNAGPYQVSGPFDDTWSFTSGFDGITWAQSGQPACKMQVYYPNFAGSPTPPSPAPVLVHHRGRGFNYDDYDIALGAHLASWGFIFVSVEDYQSFRNTLNNPPVYPLYDNNDVNRCHVSASYFQEGAMNRLLARNAASGDALFNRIDVNNIFMSGHSRGGGATHYTHHRNLNLKIKGVIYFMGYDLRNFSGFVSGTGTAPAYSGIPTPQPRLPSMIIAGENDGDLVYPICDQFIDRAVGQATFATIYGANHNYLGDANPADGSPYITRAEEQERIRNLVVAFLRRWANLDLSLEGFLYGNEFAGSNEVGVTAWRNMNEQYLLDDNQDSTNSTNTAGGVNTLSAGTMASNASIYPATGNMSSLNLRHMRLTLNAAATTTFTSTIPSAGQDRSRNRRFILRMGSVDTASAEKGFDWVTVRVRLTDAQNDNATITLFDRNAQNSTYLPDYAGTANVYDRFVEANVLLSAFTTANPSLNLNQLSNVQLIFETASGSSRQLYFDDMRFE